jgi:hypothetical protein
MAMISITRAACSLCAETTKLKNNKTKIMAGRIFIAILKNLPFFALFAPVREKIQERL